VTSIEIIVLEGSAADLHGRDPFADGVPAGPAVWLCRFDAPAIVLGSRQRPDLLDRDACLRAGLADVHRRSGGGAVLLRPGDLEWIDLVLPAGVAPDDVRGSMVWAGEVWRDALVGVGAPPGGLTVHGGGMVTTPWSDLVCFAGLGPGELLFDGRKLVGLSQRRTRHGVRIQCQIHRHAIVGSIRELFGGPIPDVPIDEPAVLADIGLGSVGGDDLASALATALGQRMTPV